MIKTLIFDLDDTLYRELDFVYCGFKEVCEYLSENNSIELERLYKASIGILNKNGRGKIFDILCNRFNIKEDIENLVSIYRNTKPKIHLYDDSIYVLNKFRKNKSLAIITDGLAYVQRNKIKSLKLENVMDKIIITDDYGKNFWKPSVIPYIQVSKNFSTIPSECVYIGDNPHKDFIGARKIGMHTIRIIRDYGDYINVILSSNYEADYNIKNMYEIENILEFINNHNN